MLLVQQNNTLTEEDLEFADDKIIKCYIGRVEFTMNNILGVPQKMTRLYNVISTKILNLTSSNFLQ